MLPMPSFTFRRVSKAPSYQGWAGSNDQHPGRKNFWEARCGHLSAWGPSAMTDYACRFATKKAMMAALHREHAFSDMFVAYLLARNIRYEEDLVDQLFNSSEKDGPRASSARLLWQGKAYQAVVPR